MKIVVFGATGKTGKEIVARALAKGHQVTAFVRDPSRLAAADEKMPANGRLHVVTGDVFDFAAVKQALKGQEAAICALGSSSLTKTAVRSQGTANIIRAMEEESVERLLVVSAMGTGESWSSLSLINRLVYATLLRSSRQDHEAQEARVKASALSWTIMRPSGLTDDPATGTYAIGPNVQAVRSQIARADVAHALIKALEDEAFVHQAVTITNS